MSSWLSAYPVWLGRSKALQETSFARLGRLTEKRNERRWSATSHAPASHIILINFNELALFDSTGFERIMLKNHFFVASKTLKINPFKWRPCDGQSSFIAALNGLWMLWMHIAGEHRMANEIHCPLAVWSRVSNGQHPLWWSHLFKLHSYAFACNTVVDQFGSFGHDAARTLASRSRALEKASLSVVSCDSQLVWVEVQLIVNDY